MTKNIELFIGIAFSLFIIGLVFGGIRIQRENTRVRLEKKKQRDLKIKKEGVKGILKEIWYGEDALKKAEAEKKAKKEKGALKRAKDYLLGVKQKKSKKEEEETNGAQTKKD